MEIQRIKKPGLDYIAGRRNSEGSKPRCLILEMAVLVTTIFSCLSNVKAFL